LRAVYLADDHGEVASESACYTDTLEQQLDGLGTDDMEQRMQRELQNMRTGEQAISFFTKFGQLAAFKVLYCNKGASASSYDLVPVPEYKVNAEHFVISAGGVVHVKPGELSECTPLSKWMHQILMYRVVSTAAFFRLYPKRKSFMNWRSGALHSLYSKRRQLLQRQCFLAKPTFAAHLMSIRSPIYEAEEVQLLSLPEANNESFGTPEASQSKLVQGRANIVSILERLVGQVTQLTARAHPTAAKSLAAAKEDARELARVQQLIAEDVDRLADFMRMVDHMHCSALRTSVHSATSRLLRALKPFPPEHPRKLFAMTIGLGGQLLQPTAEDITETLASTLDGFYTCVDQIPSFASSPILKYHVNGDEERRRVPWKETLESDSLYSADVKSLQNALRLQLQEATEYALETCAPLRRIAQHGAQWNEYCYSKSAASSSYDILAADMSRMCDFQESINSCRPFKMIGALRLETAALKSSLSKIPEESLTVMKKLLFSLARSRYTEAQKRIDACVKALEDRPTETANLRRLEESYQSVVQDRDALERLAAEVLAMYGKIKSFGIWIATDEQTRIDLMNRSAVKLFGTIIPQAAYHVESNRDCHLEVEVQLDGCTEECHLLNEHRYSPCI
jgi:dynein heavy chain